MVSVENEEAGTEKCVRDPTHDRAHDWTQNVPDGPPLVPSVFYTVVKIYGPKTVNRASECADKDALVTVMLNLLDNAYKYCDNDRHVFLRAYLADGNVCLEVEDNGIGISRRACRKMFDRFWQADRSLSRNVGGCGLGLSIVKFIVEAHGGSIDVKSQPDKGSTFTVKLPATLHDRNSG